MECEERYRDLLSILGMDCQSAERWTEWLSSIAIEIGRLNPSSAVQEKGESRAKDKFLCFWMEAGGVVRDSVISAFERALSSSSVPTPVVDDLISLIEYMMFSECAFPVRISIVIRAAEKHELFAKALFLRELEFRASRFEPSSECVEALISLNIKLGNVDSAQGILRSSAASFVRVRPSWHENLQNWKGALDGYSDRLLENPDNQDWLSGRMRCLQALGEWDRLLSVGATVKTIHSWKQTACYNLMQWDELGCCEDQDVVITSPLSEDFDSVFYKAAVRVHRSHFPKARSLIRKARGLLDERPFVSLSHPRVYLKFIQHAQVDQLEEILEFKETGGDAKLLKKTFDERLRQMQYSLEVWQRLVPMRSLALNPSEEDIDVWVRFSTLARKTSNLDYSERIIDRFLGLRPDHSGLILARIKNLYASGEKAQATEQLELFLLSEANTAQCSSYVLSKCCLALALWLPAHDARAESYAKKSVHLNPKNLIARNALALLKFREAQLKGFGPHVIEAVRVLFQCVADQGQLPNVLRLLTLWFSFFGCSKELDSVFDSGFDSVPLKVWVQAIPQILARLRSRRLPLRASIQSLLARIAREYPQSIVFSLTVASEDASSSSPLSAGASAILQSVDSDLVQECSLIARELVRISATWTEQWAANLEEASRLYYVEKDPGAMLTLLNSIHEKLLREPPSTPNEGLFVQEFQEELFEAWNWVQKYSDSLDSFYLEQAWGIYYTVFQRMHRKVAELKSFSLVHVSPRLNAMHHSKLHVPGTQGAATMHSFVGTVEVMNSKQKPRILVLVGSDGKQYRFLLKGNEDLKQDERVMQLFTLINSIVSESADSIKRSSVLVMTPSSSIGSLHDVQLKRYAVVPLSSNAGLIEWVTGCNTLHALIKQVRDKRNVSLSLEHSLMRQTYPKYEELPLLDKVAVFKEALSFTSGDELQKSMWLSSAPFGAETWLKRRSLFARSLAVTSIVGYILGLGDRHPSNLLIEEQTGQVIHIDFGDCFDVAATRDRFPEKIPFRLTRQLVNALDASGVDGMFRITAERMMDLVQKNSDSIMAMLEAFIYDPLITWRLSKNPGNNDPESLSMHAKTVLDRVHSKLIGDGKPIESHVDQLIREAMAPENLCQCYVGWCPFW